MTEPVKRVRCAVYTRKSSEEGLEQAFNSLDAQREAAIAYITSQKHEGWELIPAHYDDGGYSGGNMERPALKQLMQDIKDRKVDIIVVYKVDRLSRSLHDFARMMSLFEKQNVSFVSVTQQFNTTTSMGRLTLNILLSFAQFEREVTGERIRDKVAASKQRGMFMGGNPPIGYRSVEGKLVILEEEAKLVKKIFDLYLECHSLLEVLEVLNREGHTTKAWQTTTGRNVGGKPFKPGYLNHVLRNPIYMGKIRHKEKLYNGLHEAIIEEAKWHEVQDSIQRQNRNDRQRWRSFYLLKGKLKTHEGFTMSPSFTKVNDKRNKHTNVSPGKSGNLLQKQVRYYISRKALTQGYKNCDIKTLNADLLEGLVLSQMLHYLKQNYPQVVELLECMPDELILNHWLREIIGVVVVGTERLSITLKQDVLSAILSDPEFQEWKDKDDNKNQIDRLNKMMAEVWHQPLIRYEEEKIIITLSILIKRVNGIRMLLTPEGKDLVLPNQVVPDASIVQAIGRAFKWRQMLEAEPDLSLRKFATNCKFEDSYVTKTLSLLRLAPDILHRALTGTLPPSIKLNRLTEAAKYLSWAKQRQLIGLN